jgi:hypothetical protein
MKRRNGSIHEKWRKLAAWRQKEGVKIAMASMGNINESSGVKASMAES